MRGGMVGYPKKTVAEKEWMNTRDPKRQLRGLKVNLEAVPSSAGLSNTRGGIRARCAAHCLNAMCWQFDGVVVRQWIDRLDRKQGARVEHEWCAR